MTSHEEIRIFMDEYFASITPELLESPGELSKLMPHYLQPLTLIDGSNVLTMPEEEDIAKKLLGGMAANAASGWTSTRTDHEEILVLNPALGLVSRCFSRLREDGSVLEKGGCLYTLIKIDGHWESLRVCIPWAGRPTDR